jgi:hypothetical protein
MLYSKFNVLQKVGKKVGKKVGRKVGKNGVYRIGEGLLQVCLNRSI